MYVCVYPLQPKQLGQFSCKRYQTIQLSPTSDTGYMVKKKKQYGEWYTTF